MRSEADDENPFEVGQITERLPAWELWEDGIEPEDDLPLEAPIADAA
jgi:hypothetical protein